MTQTLAARSQLAVARRIAISRSVKARRAARTAPARSAPPRRPTRTEILLPVTIHFVHAFHAAYANRAPEVSTATYLSLGEIVEAFRLDEADADELDAGEIYACLSPYDAEMDGSRVLMVADSLHQLEAEYSFACNCI